MAVTTASLGYVLFRLVVSGFSLVLGALLTGFGILVGAFALGFAFQLAEAQAFPVLIEGDRLSFPRATILAVVLGRREWTHISDVKRIELKLNRIVRTSVRDSQLGTSLEDAQVPTDVVVTTVNGKVYEKHYNVLRRHHRALAAETAKALLAWAPEKVVLK
ncbi:MAG TPA: hypothetical protein VF992_04765 [Thermoplasmata archaeon]